MPSYNLEQRALDFAKGIVILCKKVKPAIYNREIISQLLRSSSSVGANYIEANDALGKKDFLFRLRISRKEAKETIYWLNLLNNAEPEFKTDIDRFIDEARQLKNILSAIITKSAS